MLCCATQPPLRRNIFRSCRGTTLEGDDSAAPERGQCQENKCQAHPIPALRRSLLIETQAGRLLIRSSQIYVRYTQDVIKMNEKGSRIEAIIGRKVKRDITRMSQLMKGNLEKAAESILNTPDAHVGIVTGFFIQHATPPSPETDGLIGMGHLAAGLASAGVPVTVITDAPCAKAVWAVVDAVPEQIDLEVGATNGRSVYRLRRCLEGADRPMTHLIAIERVSPAADGKPHRELGWDMSGETAPLHLLFYDLTWQRRWTTIGILAVGNEICIRALPADVGEAEKPDA